MLNHQDPYQDIRDAVRDLCAQFPDEYHRKVDEQRGYPEAFVDALTKAGWMAALIPQEYGGSGLSMAEASVIMEEINRSGGNSGACHGQMYVMNAIVRSGSQAQKDKFLPKIATGELRIQSMGVTEPTTGSDTTKLKTTAVKKDGRWVINGQKVWISRIQHSDLMILLARTTPADQVKKRSEGLSCFLIDLKQAIGNGLTVRPIRPEDEAQHLEFLQHLDPEDVRLRVFYSRRSIERSELARLTQVDYERELAYIATRPCADAPGGEETLAVVRAVTEAADPAAAVKAFQALWA